MRLALHPSRRRSRDDGASLVEFALILPVFAMLLFGFIDFGLIFGGFITLRADVNAGARDASVDYVSPACQAASNPMLCQVQDQIGNLTGVDSSKIQVAITNDGTTDTAPTVNDPVEVCAVVPIVSETGITAPFVDGDALHVTSVIRVEQTGPVPWSFSGSCGA
jgi:Flp pilus assembly protein TadG